MRTIIIMGLLARLAHAAFVAYGKAFYVHGVDAQGFHDMAIAIVAGEGAHQLREGYWYVSLLSALYQVVGMEMVLGNLLSVVVWLVCAKFLDAALWRADASLRARVNAMAIFAFLPTNVIYTSITLREGFEQAVLCVAAWAVFSSSRIGPLRALACLIGCCVAGGMLHRAVAIGAAVGGVIVVMRHRRALGVAQRFAMTVVAVAGALGGVAWNLRFSHDSGRSILSEVAFHRYAASTQPGRSNYVASGDFTPDTPIRIPEIMLALVQYFLEPAPWRAESVVDAYLILENLLRLVLLAKAIQTVRSQRGPKRIETGGILVAWMLLELLWAIGTTNWGTALRHHVPGLCLLLIAAFAGRPWRYRYQQIGDAAPRHIICR